MAGMPKAVAVFGEDALAYTRRGSLDRSDAQLLEQGKFENWRYG